MYVEIVGRWIVGPMADAGIAPRVPQPIEWPRSEDGTVSIRVLDQDDQPLALNLGGGDSITFSVGQDTHSSSLFDVVGTQGPDPEQYLFTITAAQTRLYSGPLVYEVRATQAGKTQQVAPVAYFTLTPKVVST